MLDKNSHLSAQKTVSAKLGTFVWPYAWDPNIDRLKLFDMQMDLVKQIGFKYVRFPFLLMGEWLNGDGLNWLYPDHAINACLDAGITPICPWEIDGDNGTDYLTPQMPYFKRVMEAIVNRYAGKGLVWEGQNEPYYLLAQSAELNCYWSDLIKQYDPDAVYSTGVFGQVVTYNNTDPVWQRAIDLGFLKNADAWSLHSYVDKPEDILPRGNSPFQQTMIKNNIAIISTEFGWISAKVGAQTQANYLIREILLLDMLGQPIISLYTLTDSSAVGEYGLYTGTWGNLQPQQSAIAVKELVDELGDYYFVDRLTTNDSDYVLRYQNNEGQEKIVYWTAAEPHAANINGQSINLTETPQYTPTVMGTLVLPKLVGQPFDQQLALMISNYNSVVVRLNSLAELISKVSPIQLNLNSATRLYSDRDYYLWLKQSTYELNCAINHLIIALNEAQLYLLPNNQPLTSVELWCNYTLALDATIFDHNWSLVTDAINDISAIMQQRGLMPGTTNELFK